MSIVYLQHLAVQELPYRTGNHTEIDQIVALRSAELVLATVPSAGEFGYKGEGVVKQITRKGLQEIRGASASAARD